MDSLSRRSVLKRACGVGVVGTVAAVGVSTYGARDALAQTTVTLEDASAIADNNRETDVGRVNDVIVGGVVESSYRSPDLSVTAVAVDVSLSIHWEQEPDTVYEVDHRLSLDDVAPDADSISAEPSFSLVSETGLTWSHFTPGPINQTKQFPAELSVTVSVLNDGDAFATAEGSDSATLTISLPEDETAEASLALTGGEFAFDVQTGSE